MFLHIATSDSSLSLLTVYSILGTLPSTLTGLVALSELHLDRNSFDGMCPYVRLSGLACLVSPLFLSWYIAIICLRRLCLYLCAYCNYVYLVIGTVPPSFGCFSGLYSLDISKNSFNGKYCRIVGWGCRVVGLVVIFALLEKVL